MATMHSGTMIVNTFFFRMNLFRFSLLLTTNYRNCCKGMKKFYKNQKNLKGGGILGIQKFRSSGVQKFKQHIRLNF